MIKRIVLMGSFFPALFAAAAAVSAAPIYINPGQCIIVGNQEVCARASAASLPEVRTDPEQPLINFVCTYDLHPTSETPQIKTYAMHQVTVSAFGRKTVAVLRTYGPLATDKEVCEKDAERHRLKPAIR